jgi:hypothetical protein
MEEKIYEEFNIPEWVKVDINEYFNLKEDLDCYKHFKNLVKEELESEETSKIKLNVIKELVEMLEKNLHH